MIKMLLTKKNRIVQKAIALNKKDSDKNAANLSKAQLNSDQLAQEKKEMEQKIRESFGE